MILALFDYPKNAFFGKAIPKIKFYEHGNVSSKLKDLFVKQVDQITWLYKLAPETINVQATKNIPEIQVIEIALKGDDLSEDILLCIDNTVQYPIIFEIKSAAGIKVVCSLKTKSGDGGWKISGYMQSRIFAEKDKRVPLEIGLNLGSIYQRVISSMSGIKIKDGESLDSFVVRNISIKTQKTMIDRLKKKIDSEKQFNKRVELNSRMHIMVDELNHLIG